jgi:hypothetical protein
MPLQSPFSVSEFNQIHYVFSSRKPCLKNTKANEQVIGKNQPLTWLEVIMDDRRFYLVEILEC